MATVRNKLQKVQFMSHAVMMWRGLSWLKVCVSDGPRQHGDVIWGGFRQIVGTGLGRGETSGLSEWTVLQRLTGLVSQVVSRLVGLLVSQLESQLVSWFVVCLFVQLVSSKLVTYLVGQFVTYIFNQSFSQSCDMGEKSTSSHIHPIRNIISTVKPLNTLRTGDADLRF